jgi:hypothetical protein
MATLYVEFDPEELDEGPLAITIGRLGMSVVMLPDDPDPGEEEPEDEEKPIIRAVGIDAA